jgi:hypothetical protein
LQNFILIISLLIVGMLLKRSGKFPDNTAQTLNLFVIYVSYPALVLLKTPELKLSLDLLAAAIMPWIVLIISAICVWALSKIFDWNRQITGALLLIVPLGNTSFLGFPMVQAFYGPQAVGYALMYDQLGSFLALAIYGSSVLAIYANDGEQATLGSVVKSIITFPPFISLIIALALHGVQLPGLYFSIIDPIAMTLIPVVMVAVGFQLSLKVEINHIQPFVLGLGVKMIVAPATALIIFLALGLNTEIYKVTVFEAAMPPMISAGALAIMANLSPRLTAAMIAYGIFLSFVTLPLFYYAINWLLG